MSREDSTAEMIHPTAIINIDQIDVDDQPMNENDEETKLGMLESIREDKLIYEVVVTIKPTGRYRVVDGRTRFELLKKLGCKQIPCKIIEDAQKAYLLSVTLERYHRHALSSIELERLTKVCPPPRRLSSKECRLYRSWTT